VSAAHRPVSVPWRVGDLLGLYAGAVASGAMVVAAWWGASGSDRFPTQLGFADLGVAGIVVGATSAALWLASGRRAVGERQEAALAALAALGFPAGGIGRKTSEPARALPEPAEDATAAEAPAPPRAEPGARRRGGATLVASARMTRYHRPDCPLVVGKPAVAMTRQAHERSGRRPCGVCEP
jgi:hypothetical protein